MFPEVYHAMLQKLLDKTKYGKLSWYECNRNGEVILRNGDYVYKITRMGDTLFSDYRIIINGLRGQLDMFAVKKDEARYNEVGELYAEALRYARNIPQVVKHIEETIDATVDATKAKLPIS